jgi:hypothetical protein
VKRRGRGTGADQLISVFIDATADFEHALA